MKPDFQACKEIRGQTFIFCECQKTVQCINDINEALRQIEEAKKNGEHPPPLHPVPQMPDLSSLYCGMQLIITIVIILMILILLYPCINEIIRFWYINSINLNQRE